MYGWSQFDPPRNIDFHGFFWVRPQGNIAVDPVPMSAHDRAHADELGGIATIVITNSDHVRDTAALAAATGARVLGPAGEEGSFPIACDGWLADGDEVVNGMRALALDGSKTPGELALLIEGTTLVTGDLVRAHEGGRLCLLPDAKLVDRERALASVARLAELPDVDAVLPGDGWPIFSGGRRALRELVRG